MFSIDVEASKRCASDLELVADTLEKVRGALASASVESAMAGSAGLRVQQSIQRASDVAQVYGRGAASLSVALSQIADTYTKAESGAKSKLPATQADTAVSRNSDANLADGSGVFDSKGGYGGDQGDMEHNQSGFKFLWWRFFENGELFDAVRKYPGYENYTDDQIAELFKEINSEGCGYVAMANSIFMQFESDPAAFERTFGFPMYDKDGEFNFNRLILDFYCTTDDMFYLDEDSGTHALVVEVLNSYEDHPQDFIDKYGMAPFADEDHYNPDAMQAVANDYQNRHVVNYETSGTTTSSLDNRLEHYLSQKGLSYTSEIDRNGMTASELRNTLDSGKCVNIASGGFNLYDSEGNVVASDVGDHWMTVTGVTADGNYVVSSWGDKYYIHPNELSYQDYLIMDVK